MIHHDVDFYGKHTKSQIFLHEPGFEPGAAGWEARMLPLKYAAPNYSKDFASQVKFQSNQPFIDLFAASAIRKKLIA